MLLNLRSSVNWRFIAVACLCGMSLLFQASGASAQDTTAYYSVGSEGVWVQGEHADSLPVENESETITYQGDPSQMPEYDSVTALEQYEPSTEMHPETYDDTCDSCAQEPAEAYMVVKNKDFFGVDRDDCRDEWSNFCDCNDTKLNCGCGCLEAMKKRLGLSWLRSSDSGEDCDRCKAGCCKKRKAACRQN